MEFNLFHSLYILFKPNFIFRTTEEIQSGELQWPFWTKLVVVAIGFTGEKKIKHLHTMNARLYLLYLFRGSGVHVYSMQSLPSDLSKVESLQQNYCCAGSKSKTFTFSVLFCFISRIFLLM